MFYNNGSHVIYLVSIGIADLICTISAFLSQKILAHVSCKTQCNGYVS